MNLNKYVALSCIALSACGDFHVRNFDPPKEITESPTAVVHDALVLTDAEDTPIGLVNRILEHGYEIIDPSKGIIFNINAITGNVYSPDVMIYFDQESPFNEETQLYECIGNEYMRHDCNMRGSEPWIKRIYRRPFDIHGYTEAENLYASKGVIHERYLYGQESRLFDEDDNLTDFDLFNYQMHQCWGLHAGDACASEFAVTDVVRTSYYVPLNVISGSSDDFLTDDGTIILNP